MCSSHPCILYWHLKFIMHAGENANFNTCENAMQILFPGIVQLRRSMFSFLMRRRVEAHAMMFARWASTHFVSCRVVLCCIPKLSIKNDGSIYLYIGSEASCRKERMSTRQVFTNLYASEVCPFEPNPRHMIPVRTKRVISRSQTPEAADAIENGIEKHPRYDKIKGRTEAADANLTQTFKR